MSQQSQEAEARLRRQAVKMYSAGQSVNASTAVLHRSRRWVYHWVNYQHSHPHTHYRSASRAPRQHPNQISQQMTRRISQVRATLEQQRKPVGARTIHRELLKRRLEPCPSPRTIQRVLQRQGLTHPGPETEAAYRPHPAAEYPNAVQATDTPAPPPPNPLGGGPPGAGCDPLVDRRGRRSDLYHCRSLHQWRLRHLASS